MNRTGPSANASTLPAIGRYEIISDIASGGMGSVVLARLAAAGGFQRLFAIKVPHPQYGRDQLFLDMLLDEGRIAARIHHPNVVAIQEVCRSDEHGYFLVMDYVEGFSLAHVNRSFERVDRQSWQIVLRVVIDTLEGLEAAHTVTDDDGAPLGVVHRDLSPQNILVGADGVARVTDFGIAKAASRLTSTKTGHIKGKLAYMSPEQILGGVVEARSDVFAMGTVLWEALAGKRPFGGSTDAAIIDSITTRPAPRLRDACPGIPPAFDEICARAMQRDAYARFPSARRMAEAIETAATEAGLLASSRVVGQWMRATFADGLARRREAIRSVASQEQKPVKSLVGSVAISGVTGDTAPDAMPTRVESVTEPNRLVETRPEIRKPVSDAPLPLARRKDEHGVTTIRGRDDHEEVDSATTVSTPGTNPLELREPAARAAVEAPATKAPGASARPPADWRIGLVIAIGVSIGGFVTLWLIGR